MITCIEILDSLREDITIESIIGYCGEESYGVPGEFVGT